MINQNSRLSITQLEQLSSEELYRYCFVRSTNGKNSYDNFKEEIFGNQDIYKVLCSLQGKPLNYLISKIYIKTKLSIPDNYILNPKLMYALETTLRESKSEAIQFGLTEEANDAVISWPVRITSVIAKALVADNNDNFNL